MSISLRQALRLAVGPANVDAAGHAVADWFDSIDRNATANRVREALRDQPDQPAPAVPHSQPDTSLRAELLQKLATHREVLLSLCDRVDRLEARADGLTPIERVERHWAKERSVKESLTVGGDRLAVPEDREPVALVGEPTDAELGSLWAGAAHIDQEHGGVMFARAVLARWGHQPAPPAEGEVGELVALILQTSLAWGPDACLLGNMTARQLTRAAELLQQRPEPVPVSERLPGLEDCGVEGQCWVFRKVEKEWRLLNVRNMGVAYLKYFFSHWLPATALPLPAGEGK